MASQNSISTYSSDILENDKKFSKVTKDSCTDLRIYSCPKRFESEDALVEGEEDEEIEKLVENYDKLNVKLDKLSTLFFNSEKGTYERISSQGETSGEEGNSTHKYKELTFNSKIKIIDDS
jgi:hypothetical protein